MNLFRWQLSSPGDLGNSRGIQKRENRPKWLDGKELTAGE